MFSGGGLISRARVRPTSRPTGPGEKLHAVPARLVSRKNRISFFSSPLYCFCFLSFLFSTRVQQQYDGGPPSKRRTLFEIHFHKDYAPGILPPRRPRIPVYQRFFVSSAATRPAAGVTAQTEHGRGRSDENNTLEDYPKINGTAADIPSHVTSQYLLVRRVSQKQSN